MTSRLDNAKSAPEILLVEDLVDTVEGLTQDLEYRGAAVFHATTLDSASTQLHENGFRAILVDLNIPARIGEPPSPENGRALVRQLCGLTFPLNQDAHYMIITAQKVDLRPTEFSDCAKFIGIGSKIGDSRWLLRKLADLGLISMNTDLDADSAIPQRERVQLVFHGWSGSEALLEAPDLSFGSFLASSRLFTEGLRRSIDLRPKPVLLWGVGNVLAETPEDLRLRELSVSSTQLDPTRDYSEPTWLKFRAKPSN